VANEPVCWVIPGDDNAKMNGAVDAMAWREGEFTKPLFDQPNSFSMDRHIEALDRVALLEGALHCINTLNDSPARFNKEIQDVLNSVIDTSDVKF
jgi:hypothetical protein